MYYNFVNPDSFPYSSRQGFQKKTNFLDFTLIRLLGFGVSQKQELMDSLTEIQIEIWNGLQPKAIIFMENIKAYLEHLDAK